MGQCLNSSRRVVGAICCLVFFICVSNLTLPHAFASKIQKPNLGFSQDTKANIRNVGLEIKTRDLIAHPITHIDIDAVRALPETARLATFRRMASAVTLERREASGIAILSVYKTEAISLNSARDIKIATLYENYLQVRMLGPNHEKSTSYMRFIDDAKSNEDWFTAHRAHVLTALLHARQRRYNLALSSLAEAAKLQPSQIDNITREASYEQSTILSFVYGVTGNASATLDAVQDLIIQGSELGEPIDGITHFNNLIYLSSKWHEYDLSADLSRMMLSMPDLSDHDKAIGHMRLSQALNRTGEFEEALKTAEIGLTLNPPYNWVINLKIECAIALAGMGDVEAAQAAVAKIKAEIKTHPRFNNMFKKSFLKIDALIARASNDPEQLYDSLVQHNQIDMQRQLKSNERANNNYLKALQKSEAVTREREAAQRAKLDAVTLQRDNRTKQLAFTVVITVLLALFSAVGLYLAKFYRKTSRNNAKLRDLAMAGERSKSEFLAVMSHELRTPLNGIIGLSDILSREAATEDVKFKSSVIMRSGLTLLDLLTNILDMSKMDRGQIAINPAPMAIRGLIDSLRELWMPKATAQGLALTLHVDESVPEFIMLDNMRLRQCAENLISNAIKFTSKGRVHVHVTGSDSDKDGLFNLTFIVADTGRGMSQDQVDTVFEPFTQADATISREFGGSGLGMAITRSLARLMEGDVTVTSREGRGSEFTMTVRTHEVKDHNVTAPQQVPQQRSPKSALVEVENVEQEMTQRARRLEKIDAAIHAANSAANIAVKADITTAKVHPPLPAPEALVETAAPKAAPQNDEASVAAQHIDVVPTPKSTAHSSDPFRGLRILIAEDIISNQEILKVFLNPVGAVVTCVANGQEALDALEQDHFDLVLMDIRMPVMNGIDATARIRAMSSGKASIPIIALTADASAENNAKCMAAGANVFLTKPVVATELFGSVRFVLKQAEQQRLRQRSA